MEHEKIKERLIDCLKMLTYSKEQRQVYDKHEGKALQIIEENYHSVLWEVTILIENKELSYSTVARILKVYIFLVSVDYFNEKIIKDSFWTKIKGLAERAIDSIMNPEYVSKEIQNKERDEYILKEFEENLRILSLPFNEQEVLFPIANIPSEILMDFEVSFFDFITIIPAGYISYKALAMIFRTYLKLIENFNELGFPDEDLFASDDRWLKVRELALESLFFLNPKE